MASTTKTVEHNRLTQADLAEVQKILLSKRQSLIENSVSLIQNAEHNGSNHSDLIDKASVEEEFRMKLCAQALEQNLIRDIDNALQNIKNGTFGYCELCGNEIGKKRIQAYPTATHCIECKTTFEAKSRSQTHGVLA